MNCKRVAWLLWVLLVAGRPAGAQGIGVNTQAPPTVTDADGGVFFGAGGVLQYRTTGVPQVNLGRNIYFDTAANTYKYLTNGPGVLFQFDQAGRYMVWTAPSGTAGASAALTLRSLVDSDGRAGFGSGITDVTTLAGAGLAVIPRTGSAVVDASIAGSLRTNDYRVGSSSVTPSLVYVGDSLTVGSGGTHPYPFYITPPTYHGLTFATANIAQGGETLTHAFDHAAADLNPLYAAHAGDNVAVVWLGTNDITNDGATAAQAFSLLQAYCAHERQLGFSVVVVTMISRSGQDTAKNAYNTLIRANWPQFADALADVATDTHVGADGAYSNGTYFTDGVHLTDAGYVIVAGIVQTALTAVVP